MIEMLVKKSVIIIVQCLLMLDSTNFVKTNDHALDKHEPNYKDVLLASCGPRLSDIKLFKHR